MLRTLRRLWADDAAAVISTELVLVLAILVFGIIPGLVAIRNSVITVLVALANFFQALAPTVTFSQVVITSGTGSAATGSAATGFVILVGPNTSAVPLTGVQLAPINVTYLPLSPAP